MSDINIPYKKLKGSAFLSSNRLYMGPDHLLSITGNFFSEEYLRFYYRDIQAIITRKTIKGKVLNICLSAGLILFLTFAVLLSGAWSIFFVILSAVFFVPLLINFLKGPTSISHIQTPIQTFRLSAIHRMKNAIKAVTQLKTLIEQTQGVLTDDLIERLRDRENSDASYKNLLKIIKHENGLFHLIVFSLLTFHTLFIGVDIFFQDLMLTLISNVIVAAIAILLIIALIRQKDSDLNKIIKGLAWSIIGYLCLIIIFSNILSFFVTIQNQEIVNNQLELIKRMSAISPLSNPWLLGISVFSLVFSLFTGITGIVLTLKFRKGYNLMQEEQRPVEKGFVTSGLKNE
ncbi:MAG: hypothetical protein JXL81_10250 [Deltaproteobacteria bacterium]|nr:hypothetical protein [Deltaproteobacteria bacterium]